MVPVTFAGSATHALQHGDGRHGRTSALPPEALLLLGDPDSTSPWLPDARTR